MSIRRRLTVFALILVPIFVFAAPARAGSTPSTSDPFVVITGRLDVPQGDTVRDAVIFNGPANVEGTVTNNVVAFNGDVVVSGSVGGNVTALNGRVTVTAGAHVGGDVESQGDVVIAPGTVSGTTKRVTGFRTGDVGFAFLGRVFLWLIATVSSLLLGLALTLWMPRAADALAETSARRTGASFGFGALWFFGIPVAGALLAVTVLAGLIGLGLLLGLLLIYTVAYAIGAFMLGRRLVVPPRGRFTAFLAGWAILRVVAFVPVLGGIAWILTVIWGLGAFMLTAFRAARGKTSGGGAALAMTASAPSSVSQDAARPPMPPMPT